MPLRPKKPRRVIRRVGWFQPKNLPHFDAPLLSAVEAMRIAGDPVAVAQNSFLPLISFTKRHRRFTISGPGRQPVGSVKDRPLAFCGNRDATIFAYYAHILGDGYEALLDPLGIDACVIGYRRGRSNIECARDAFAEIAGRGRCVALALDVEGFFDNLPHSVLKLAWARVLGRLGGDLPKDHYAVFRALTCYSKVDRDRCLERLGLSADGGLEGLPKPLCTIADFRRLIRGNGGVMPSIIHRNSNPWGIPQGTPLSPVAANIAMLDFDVAVAAEVARVGGIYRRYSDDILVICAPGEAEWLEAFISTALITHAPGLKLKEKKAQRVQFFGGRARCAPSPLQYLGFTFDGQRVLLRSSTIARQWRRLAAAARWAKARQGMAHAGLIDGRPTVHRKNLLTRFSHLGEGNFHTGYAAKAGQVMGTSTIKRQLRNHMAFLAKRLR
jgi:RNA-directed DNA polymerase